MIQPTHKPVPAGNAAAVTRMGTVHSDAPAIYLYQDVLAAVIRHSETDLRRELGGFLLGGLHHDRRVYVEVRAFLPAVATSSGTTSLRFTHDTWAAMTRRAEADHPGDLVLGWQHTHPGLGVFLSAHDVFIHRHFFSQPWQIAMVVDPRSRQLALFQWRGSDLADCGFMHVQRDPQRTTR
jgi:proteasome lid subunit RPN8/RPN11